ncbi:DUF1770-domain-containing protein [Aulographum hederae CBS 113979]|uniref:DUF1770-domain-containing protein n=1 Tax=Aulographum hederae CBS 113979 TaxID=1176131 RepID=A0A6G1H180_9PEZI|nr:DUF1770-domain-containing protein [Aulographum hederae CBS 113979]
MAHNPAAEIGSILQSASIKRHPSPSHDLNPSTAASRKQPVRLSGQQEPGDSDVDDDEIPLSVLRPLPRKPTLPPLPDLRFEQSYLKSIEHAEGWGFKSVGYITIRDQVLLPLVQGVVWTLLQSGWRYWNRSSQFSGKTAGARLRRWWWGVNNWKVPDPSRESKAKDIKEFYEDKFSNAGAD